MRRLLTSVLTLSLMVAGFLPLAAPVTANVCDHATIVANGRHDGTIAVVSNKRSPAAQSTVTLFATIAPTDATKLAWTRDLIFVPSSTIASIAGLSALSPRAPPIHLIAA